MTKEQIESAYRAYLLARVRPTEGNYVELPLVVASPIRNLYAAAIADEQKRAGAPLMTPKTFRNLMETVFHNEM